jgi:hypothetical protein
MVRRKLFDRWKRRQFYVDEEEGALAPEGWTDGDEVLLHVNGTAGTSKSAMAMSPRSRSSSKVRFAEDTDDFETRSNHSASSRSIPERWGGMDIPDAERDAGKEILYQVTQQAFNELLDVLFKEKEELAMLAANTATERDKHRALFKDIDLAKEGKGKTAGSGTPAGRGDRISDQPLAQLLESSGYTIAEEPELEEEDTLEFFMNFLYEDKAEGAGGASSDTEEAPITEDRDPTMPQFRPNGVLPEPMTARPPNNSATPSSSRLSPLKTPANRLLDGTPQRGAPGRGKARAEPSQTPTPIPRQKLIEWKRIDAAEQEAVARGGWGRLSYAEFAEIYHAEEQRHNRLDYLGSWIDFCIP